MLLGSALSWRDPIQPAICREGTDIMTRARILALSVWEYFGSRAGGGFGQTPWWGQSRRCKLSLRGPDEHSLRFTDITC